ncbi:MAG TPA: DUF5777 family beta-barrel protein [Chitinophagaceae bacterium]|nr:DUF5777 family beta-barrel protein [Chitinophagaceae bacterium]
MRTYKLILLSALLLPLSAALSQDTSLLKLLDDSMAGNKTHVPVTGTFKGTHIINIQSVEAPAKRALMFWIMHRFGQLNDGAYQLFGLDNATMRFGFDYGLTDRLSIGVGRSTFEKTFDGTIKYKVLRQTEDDHIPITADLFGGIYYKTLKYDDKPYLNTTYRTSYAAELLLAKKFDRNLSIQLTPIFLHYNLVQTTGDKNNIFAMGFGGRVKLTRRLSLNAEYDYLPTGQVNSINVHSSLSLGFDIETGGHVFQLHVTNSQGMIDPVFISQTTGTWGKGNIFFGFNVSRAFNTGKKAKKS